MADIPYYHGHTYDFGFKMENSACHGCMRLSGGALQQHNHLEVIPSQLNTATLTGWQ